MDEDLKKTAEFAQRMTFYLVALLVLAIACASDTTGRTEGAAFYMSVLTVKAFIVGLVFHEFRR